MQSVVFIVGIPGSGKTTLAMTEYVTKGYIFYDDCVGSFIDGKAERDIREGRNVCLADPRFCYRDVFVRFLSKVIDSLESRDSRESRDSITVVLTENNPQLALENIRKRNLKRDACFLDQIDQSKGNDHLMRFSKELEQSIQSGVYELTTKIHK